MNVPKTFANCLLILFALTLTAQSQNPDFIIGKNRLTVDFDTVVTKARTIIPKEKITRIPAIVNDQFDEEFSASVGWKVISRNGKFATLTGDKDKVYYLASIPGIVQFRRPSSGKLFMDAARKDTHVDEVQSMTVSKLKTDFTGKGVIVGVVDSEFDHTHPAFLDKEGTSRFIAIWDQTATKETGTIPAFAFERTSQGAILNGDELAGTPEFGSTDMLVYHGTHVLSTAAGSDAGNKYTGVAPEALLLGCRVSVMGEDGFVSNIIDGITWMFHVADSLDMPCVVNLSLGDHDGPHDGTSVFDQWTSSATGKGRIIVGSAANSGDVKQHIQLDLNKESLITTKFSDASFMNKGTFWGQKGKEFSLRIHLRNTASGTVYSSNTITTNSSFESIDTIKTAGLEELVVNLVVANNHAANGKPNIHLTTMFESSDYDLILEFSGKGIIHGWSLYYSDFEKVSPLLNGTPTKGGDGDYSLAEVCGVSEHVITAGAYTTKIDMVDHNNQQVNLDDAMMGQTGYSTLNAIAPFSSKGPTLDGRIKPDIAAPGNYVVAAATAYMEGDWYTFGIWDDQTNTKGRYAAMNGTSMSSPFTAGVVALMLQACDTLSPASVRKFLQNSATQDSFTGSEQSNTWGAGKINALEAVKAVVHETAILSDAITVHNRPTLTVHDRLIRFYGIDKLNSSTSVSLVNLQGRVVFEQKLDKSNTLLLPPTLSNALYIVKLKNGVSTEYSSVKKIILK